MAADGCGSGLGLYGRTDTRSSATWKRLDARLRLPPDHRPVLYWLWNHTGHIRRSAGRSGKGVGYESASHDGGPHRAVPLDPRRSGQATTVGASGRRTKGRALMDGRRPGLYRGQELALATFCLAGTRLINYAAACRSATDADGRPWSTQSSRGPRPQDHRWPRRPGNPLRNSPFPCQPTARGRPGPLRSVHH